MNWTEIGTEFHIHEIKERSKQKLQLIFKHSTRCSISSVAKNRLERNSQPAEIDFHLLDLLRHRNISNKIAEDFAVFHESPQVLLIKNGECVYDESHNAISMDDITMQANEKC